MAGTSSYEAVERGRHYMVWTRHSSLNLLWDRFYRAPSCAFALPVQDCVSVVDFSLALRREDVYEKELDSYAIKT